MSRETDKAAFERATYMEFAAVAGLPVLPETV